MADPGLAPPYLDPSQYPDYLDAQRKSMVANMLLNSAQTGNQTPADWDSMRVVPHRGLMQNIAPIAKMLMAGKTMQSAQQAQAKYFSGLYGGGDPTAPAAAPAADPTGQPPGMAPGQTPSMAAPPAPSSSAPPGNSSMIPSGMSRQQAQAMLSMMGPEKYAEMLAQQYKPAEIQAQLRAAGIDPYSPQGRQIALAAVRKATTNVQDVRPGGTLFDVSKGQPVFSAPQNGVQTQWGPQGPTQSTVPGALEASQAAAAATTAGTESQKPIKLGTDANGRDIYGFPTPPAAMRAATNPSSIAPPGTGAAARPSYFPNATAGGQTASPAVVQGQKTGAEEGQHYASELSKNATGATEVRRSLSELSNLASQATPSASNEAKMKLGSYMIAAGVNPQTVAGWLHVDIGALQAAQKQTATLAVNTIHSMTSRGTNFDLDTFMRNNPNMNMSDPSAFNRVVQYMDNKAKQEIAKQKDFADWKVGKSPDEWETGHTAHWLDKQNTDIEAGKSNSAKPPVTKVVGGKTYIQQNGKWYQQ